MKAHDAFKSEAGPVSVSKRQRGFTLISTAISFTLSGLVLAGAWMAYRDMQAQMHVNFADRQMDQYASAAIQELSNKLSWAWTAREIQGGYNNTRWNFLVRDEVDEYGTWMPPWQLEGDGFTQVRFAPTRGLLIGNSPPNWAEDNYIDYYQWTGRSARIGETRTLDRRDRMTMESLFFDWEESDWDADQVEYENAKCAVQVELTLQYRYRANSMFGLYSRDYARERNYRTSFYMRNWPSDINEYNKPADAGGVGL